MLTVTSMTRHERRVLRRRMFISAKEASLASRLARLGYKTSGESGALKLRSKVIMGQGNGRRNGYPATPGRTWGRSGPTYVTETEELGLLPKPVLLHRWRALNKDR